MKYFILSLLPLFLLSGCNPWTSINENMQPMRGQTIEMLFAKLGYPTGEGKVAGRHFYVWSNGGSAYIPNISTTNGYGDIGGQSFSYNQTTYGGGNVVNLHCTIRVFVDQNNLIRGWDGGGNNGACAHFASSLEPR